MIVAITHYSPSAANPLALNDTILDLILLLRLRKLFPQMAHPQPRPILLIKHDHTLHLHRLREHTCTLVLFWGWVRCYLLQLSIEDYQLAFGLDQLAVRLAEGVLEVDEVLGVGRGLEVALLEG